MAVVFAKLLKTLKTWEMEWRVPTLTPPSEWFENSWLVEKTR